MTQVATTTEPIEAASDREQLLAKIAELETQVQKQKEEVADSGPSIDLERILDQALARQVAEMGDVVDVEDMMADRDEDMNEINEVSDILSQPQFDNGVDEDELMDELMGLGNEADANAANAWEADLMGPGQPVQVPSQPLPTMPTAPLHMPVAPTHEPVAEEDPFADLEASMAI